MKKNAYFLKANVLAEPLVDQWYAQPLLIPPVTAAMLTANTHLPIMNSYIADPDAHEAALEWPEMRGGPFVDYKERQVEAVEDLLKETKKKRARSLELAAAVKDWALLLEAEAKGHSLLDLYRQLPSALQGYIELGYDLMNHANFRFFESLLYASDYNLKDGQSVLLSLTINDQRSFSLSTPRIISADMLNIQLPFESEWYDRFFATRFNPISGDEIHALFSEIPNHSLLSFEHFMQLFSEEAPSLDVQVQLKGDEVRVRYLGHACLLFETSVVSIITDISLGYAFPGCSPRYSHHDLPETIDFLLITHAHQDHIQIEHLLQLRHKIKTVVVPAGNPGSAYDPSLKLLFEALGFKNVISVSDMEKVQVPGGDITAIPFLGEHGDIDIKSKSAYALRLHGFSALCLADANAIDPILYEHIGKITGKVNMLFLSLECEGAPVSWLYNAFQINPLSWEADQSRRLDASNYERALTMMNIFNPGEVYIYGMGQEPWLSHIMNLELEPSSIQTTEMKKLEDQCDKACISFEILYNKKEIIWNLL